MRTRRFSALLAAFLASAGHGVAQVNAGEIRVISVVYVIMLPFELMSTRSLDGGISPAIFTPLGRSEMGLAVPAVARHPDISTVEKLAAFALRSAKAVMRSNPAGGSMVPKVIEQNVIRRPVFAGVNSPVSTRGDGGQALARHTSGSP